MIITISGHPGTGKTTVAKMLSQKLGFEHVNAGDIFRSLAAKKGMTLEEFGAYAHDNENIDRAIDKKMVEIAQKKPVIMEGRLAAFMADTNGIKALKVWLEAPIEVRAKRVAERENKSYEAAVSEIEDRERSEWNRYFKIYGVDLNDSSYFTMVINTANLTPEEIVNQIIAKYKELNPGFTVQS